jgi:hypothetical protein
MNENDINFYPQWQNHLLNITYPPALELLSNLIVRPEKRLQCNSPLPWVNLKKFIQNTIRDTIIV